MNRINKKLKSLWGISETGIAVLVGMSTSFLIFFLTDVAKLPPSVTAAVVGFSALMDALSAMIAGVVIDKVNLKGSKYRPWLLYCPPIGAVLFVFTFTKIGSDATAGMIIIAAYIIGRFFNNIAWTANRNLLPVLTDDPGERSFLSARLAVGSSLGALISAYLVPTLTAVLVDSVGGISAYTITAAICAAIFAFSYIIHYIITKGYDKAETASKRPRVTFGDMAKGIGTNPHLIALWLYATFCSIAGYMISATAAYYAKVVLEDPAAVKWILIMFFAGTTVGSYLSSKVAKKIGVKMTTVLGTVGGLIFILICFFLPANVFLVAFFLFLGQTCLGLASGLLANLYTMCGTYSLWKTNADTRGVIMALSGLSVKISVVIRGVLIPAMLTWIAYDPNATVMTAVAKNNVKLLFFIASAAVMLISLIPLALFRLNEKKVVEMEKEIVARRAG